MGFIKDLFDPNPGSAESDAALQASARMSGAVGEAGQLMKGAHLEGSQTSAGGVMKGLQYLMGDEAKPRQFREGAMGKLAGAYGLEGGTGGQEDLIRQAMSSPLYGMLMSGQKVGEDAIMRHAGRTGGLRSGEVNTNMYDYNTRLQNNALLQSYNEQVQGLEGMMNLPSRAGEIAGMYGDIGSILGGGQIDSASSEAMGMTGSADALSQGQVASAGARANARQQQFGNVLGLANTAISGYEAFSDRRLKKNLKLVGNMKGFNWYTWTWNKLGNMLGLEGSCQGCLADEVYPTNPGAVALKNGFMTVNYQAIGILGVDHAE